MAKEGGSEGSEVSGNSLAKQDESSPCPGCLQGRDAPERDYVERDT